MKLKFKRREFNPKRRLTKREFVIINIFITILVLYFVVDSFLFPKWQTYADIREKYKTIEQTKNTLEKEYADKEKYEKEIEKLDYKIKSMQKELPVYLSQEDMVLTIYDYAKEADVNIVRTDFIEQVSLNVKEYLLPRNISEEDKDDNKAAEEKQEYTEGFISQQGMNINITGSYSQIYNFLNMVETNLRKIYVNNVTLKADDGGTLSGTVSLLFVSFADKDDNDKYTLEIDKQDSKDYIFQPYEGYGEISDTITGEIKKLEKPNFSLFINTYLNNGPKVVLKESGRAETEIYYDENAAAKGKIEITQPDSGLYSYKLTLDSYTYTKESSKMLIEDEKIKIFVYSSYRKSMEDTVEVQLDVINNTSVPVEIKVINEDRSMPRFSLGTIEGKVEME